MRNDCTIYQSDTFNNKPLAGLSSIVKLLNNMETAWTAGKKRLKQNKILKKIEKGRMQSLYIYKCLQAYKAWDSPITSIEELNNITIRTVKMWKELLGLRG